MSLFGVYWEYTYEYDDTIASFLFIPERPAGPGKKDFVGATLMYRSVSTETPQKAYRFQSIDASNAGLIGTHGDPTTLAVQMLPQLRIFAGATIQSIEGNSSFSVRGKPFLLEISDQELDNINSEATPRSLTARLYRARIANSLPALPGKAE